jgi:glycosyltransferase involved in cell wall biosynthesis
MLTVLMSDASPNWGGQQFRLVREAEWFHARGHTVIAVCGESSKLAPELERNAPGVRIEKIRSWRSPLTLLRIAKIVRQSQPDIIHTRSRTDSAWGAYFHLSGHPVVRSRHMSLPEHLQIGDTLEYRYGCRRIIAAAHFIKRDLVARVGVSDSRIDVVGEGTNLEEFHPGLDGGGFRAEFGIPSKSPLFGMIAMLRPEKGHRIFINAAAKVLKRAPDARFVIVGDGGSSYLDKLRQRIHEKFPLKPAPIILTGYLQDVTRAMAGLDFVVVPSFHEAQTIVIPQAFATGKPVIASQVGGIPELVTHEKNGLLVPPSDSEALAAAMLRVVNDPALSARLASAGLSFARRELCFERKTELVLESYYRAMGIADGATRNGPRVDFCEPLGSMTPLSEATKARSHV